MNTHVPQMVELLAAKEDARDRVLRDALQNQFDLTTVVDAPLLQRLKSIGFLGILGPGPAQTSVDTRYNHSIGVTALAWQIAEQSGFPTDITRYLLVATLLHDSANRALSHTCEGAFNALTRLTSRNLTTAIITRERPHAVPQAFGIRRHLARRGLDPQFVLLILAKRNVLPPVADISMPAELLGSPISPDTLDGIFRACAIFNEPCPDPFDLATHIFVYNGRVVVRKDSLELFDAFWSAKDNVYQRHINAPDAVRLEACVAKAASELFRGWKSERIFKLTDADIREQLLLRCRDQFAIGDSVQFSLLPQTAGLRFRDAMSYIIDRDACTDRDLVPVWELRKRYRTIPTSILTTEHRYVDQSRWHREVSR